MIRELKKKKILNAAHQSLQVKEVCNILNKIKLNLNLLHFI